MRAGTIIASNYSALAQVLGESFLAHHPDSTFTVLVVDDQPIDLPSPIRVVRLDDLDLGTAALDVMKTIYDVMEFSTSVKPSLLRLLLSDDSLGGDDAGGVVACYLDPDIEVFAPFDDQVAPALDRGIVLTPHALYPVPRDGLKVSEGTIMQSGMYNCGFLAVADAARDFLDWWDERLRFDAVVDFEQSQFTDQRWVDWVPSLFDFAICRDPGMNVAWWNIHERPIELSSDAPTTLGRPVRFVHFSGYDPATPELLSKHQLPSPRVDNAPGTGMRTLSDRYGARLVELDHLERRHTPYRWRTSDDGVELTTDVRRRIRTAMLAENRLDPDRRRTPDGFGGGEVSLGSWLAQPDPVHRDPVHRDPAHRDPVHRDPVHRDPVHRDPVHRCQALSDQGSAGAITTDRWRRGVVSAVRSVQTTSDRVAREAGRRIRRFRSAENPRDGSEPFAFLHVPKAAGSSIVASLRDALDDHTWGDQVFDPAWMGPYRHHARPPALARQVLESVDELIDIDAVAGHLTLPTLLTRFELGDIATVVREPRCRLLSHYEYWRGLDAEARDRELPWASSRSAATLDFAEWLADESIAYQSDNTLIRQLVDDPAIPENRFIANDDLARLAKLAGRCIDQLGFVGLVEEGDAVFDRLGRFVGHRLERRRINVTNREPSRAVDLTAIFEHSTHVLASRTAGDALVWRAAARRVGIANPEVLAEQSWMARLGVSVRNETNAS